MPKRKIEIFFFLFLSRLQTKNNLRSLNPFTPPRALPVPFGFAFPLPLSLFPLSRHWTKKSSK